jgi:CubicO group peptidase (beta-lactamase class C family)
VATVVAVLAAGLLCRGTSGAAAEEEPARGFRGAAEMELFVDGIMAGQRETLEIEGAVVVVVADGAVYFSKGYGYADMERKRRVDPETTLFRIGSVTKLFTATAVMQLWEQKKVNFDTDINLYLRAFRVPPTFQKAVTLGHLLAHTGGFEDRPLGLFSRDRSSVKPLAITLSEELPERVRVPGRLSVYSNHGTALAGLVVQEVSGMPWEDYIEKQILEPLGMEHAAVRQPVPVALEGDVAVGYRRVEGRFEETDFEFVPIAPAGSASVSGADMARFMIAHLQSGILEETTILSEDTTRMMHSRLFSNAPGMNGMCYGFYEMNQNGERIIGHGGGMICFYTLLALMPERGVGVFVSYNSDTGAKAHLDFWEAFLNRYFPASGESLSRRGTASLERMQSFAGEYSGLRRSHTTLTKLSALLWTARVNVDAQGALVTTGLGGGTRRWTEVEPAVFQEAEGTRRLAFRTEEAEETTYLFPDFPASTFVRHQWYQTSAFQFGLAGVSLLLMASALLFWPVVAWCTWSRPIDGSPPPGARISAWLMSLLFAAFFAGLGVAAMDPMQFAFGVPVLVQRILWLPIVAALFVAICAFFTMRAWIDGYWGFPGRLHYSLVTLAGATLLWWTWHWNLLGFHY